MGGILKCRDVSQLVSEAMDRKLPMSRTVEMKIHLLMCKFCSRFRKQVLSIRRAIRENVDLFDETVEHDALCPEAKERIKQLLQKSGSI